MKNLEKDLEVIKCICLLPVSKWSVSDKPNFIETVYLGENVQIWPRNSGQWVSELLVIGEHRIAPQGDQLHLYYSHVIENLKRIENQKYELEKDRIFQKFIAK